MITFGTNPGMVMPIARRDPRVGGRSRVREGARDTWASRPASALLGAADRRRVHRQLHELAPVSDLRAGGVDVLRGRRVAAGVRMLVVPGSQAGQASGGGGGPRSRVRRGRRRVARVRLLDVHRDERRSAVAPASTPSAPATATSKGARDRARAPSSRARSTAAAAACAVASAIRAS